MVNAAALFSWDTKLGAVLDAYYPDSFTISEDLMNKIYMAHGFQERSEKKEIMEIEYEDQIILSYCDKSRVPEVGYEILILFIHEKDKVNVHSYKKELYEIGERVFEKNKENRNSFFKESVIKFFKKPSARKLLILGRAGTGKSTIKKIVFEGANPKELISNPLEPTRGISPSVHSWLDLNLGVFDTSGQELAEMLDNEAEQQMAFENSDIIIYLMDFPNWMSNSKEIIIELKKIKKIILNNDYQAGLVLFLHKIDLINLDKRQETLQSIELIINQELDLPLYFTSIYPSLIYNTYNAFYSLLSNFSEDNAEIKRILDEELKQYKKTMSFITNTYDNIIAQSMSTDFNPLLINHSHKLIAQLNASFTDMVKNDEISYMILSSKQGFYVVMNNLMLEKFKLKNLILITEEYTSAKLMKVINLVRSQLTNFFYIRKNKT